MRIWIPRPLYKIYPAILMLPALLILPLEMRVVDGLFCIGSFVYGMYIVYQRVSYE